MSFLAGVENDQVDVDTFPDDLSVLGRMKKTFRSIWNGETVLTNKQIKAICIPVRHRNIFETLIESLGEYMVELNYYQFKKPGDKGVICPVAMCSSEILKHITRKNNASHGEGSGMKQTHDSFLKQMGARDLSEVIQMPEKKQMQQAVRELGDNEIEVLPIICCTGLFPDVFEARFARLINNIEHRPVDLQHSDGFFKAIVYDYAKDKQLIKKLVTVKQTYQGEIEVDRRLVDWLLVRAKKYMPAVSQSSVTRVGRQPSRRPNNFTTVPKSLRPVRGESGESAESEDVDMIPTKRYMSPQVKISSNTVGTVAMLSIFGAIALFM